MNCVLKLRFDPATRPVDGEPIDSWQEIAWRWASQEQHDDPQRIATRASSPPAAQDSRATIGAPNANDTGERHEESHRKDSGVAVRVCADDTGKLAQDPTILHSSGNPGLDEAALKIARSGSPYYRPGVNLDGKPVSGCARLVIEFETK
jgi:outer membrane biosynthesis protein TonB